MCFNSCPPISKIIWLSLPPVLADDEVGPDPLDDLTLAVSLLLPVLVVPRLVRFLQEIGQIFPEMLLRCSSHKTSPWKCCEPSIIKVHFNWNIGNWQGWEFAHLLICSFAHRSFAHRSFAKNRIFMYALKKCLQFFLKIERFAHPLFFGEQRERIAQVAYQKWATMSGLLRSLTKNELFAQIIDKRTPNPGNWTSIRTNNLEDSVDWVLTEQLAN